MNTRTTVPFGPGQEFVAETERRHNAITEIVNGAEFVTEDSTKVAKLRNISAGACALTTAYVDLVSTLKDVGALAPIDYSTVMTVLILLDEAVRSSFVKNLPAEVEAIRQISNGQ